MGKSIEREEWDFSGCPSDESYECLAWELSRECEAVKEHVKRLRKGIRKKTFDAYLERIGTEIFKGSNGRAMASFYFCPEFPERSYLSLKPAERKRRLETLFGKEESAVAAIIDARTIGAYPSDISRRVAHSVKTGEPVSIIDGEELALLRIKWQWTDRQLTRQFKAWLKKNRPSDVKKRVQGHGVPTTRMKYQLKNLGALRLLNKMTYTDAVTLTAETLGKALWEEQGEWVKAKTKACEMLADFERCEIKRTQNFMPSR